MAIICADAKSERSCKQYGPAFPAPSTVFSLPLPDFSLPLHDLPLSMTFHYLFTAIP